MACIAPGLVIPQDDHCPLQRERKNWIVDAKIDLAALHLVERVIRRAVWYFNGINARTDFVERAHNSTRVGSGRVACVRTLLFHRNGEFGYSLVRALGIYEQHESGIARGGRNLKCRADVNRRVFVKMVGKRHRWGGVWIQCVTIRLGARDVLGRNIATGSDAVLHNCGTP
jgi:hypothetical protein